MTGSTRRGGKSICWNLATRPVPVAQANGAAALPLGQQAVRAPFRPLSR